MKAAEGDAYAQYMLADNYLLTNLPYGKRRLKSVKNSG